MQLLWAITDKTGPPQQDIAVVCLLAGTDSAEGAALRKHPSTVLDAARGHNFPKDIAALESSIFSA